MFRKSFYILVFMLIMASYSVGFGFDNPTAAPVSASEIIVAEPVSSEIYNTKNLFLSININNTAIVEAPITVSLVEIGQKLSFIDEISADVGVSVLRLNSNSAPNTRSVALSRVYSTTSNTYSVGFAEEIDIINRFFGLKDRLSEIQARMYEINLKYSFDLLIDRSEEASKMTEDEYSAYLEWLELKSDLNTTKGEYTVLAGKYLALFETQVYSNSINKMSFNSEIGRLSNGTYALRFIDGNSMLIKQIQFKVVDEETQILPFVPFN